jgi:hypothetical protein
MNTKTPNKTKNNTSPQELRESHLLVNIHNSSSISALTKTTSLTKGGENL